jgi:cytochrome b561
MKPVATAHVDGPAAAADLGHPYPIEQYRMPAKVFHWLTAVLVILLVSSGVIAKQLNEGAIADTLLSLHKLTGALTLAVVLLRLCYRLLHRDPPQQEPTYRRPVLHWILYGTVILVPLVGWAAISDFGAREVFGGFSLPAIWPERAGYADLLFQLHAYLAFGLLALVALHIGDALQDYMIRDRGDKAVR